jgi:hypothetical protein
MPVQQLIRPHCEVWVGIYESIAPHSVILLKLAVNSSGSNSNSNGGEIMSSKVEVSARVSEAHGHQSRWARSTAGAQCGVSSAADGTNNAVGTMSSKVEVRARGARLTATSRGGRGPRLARSAE